MKFINKLALVAALAASAFLVGCGGGNPEPTFTAGQVKQAATEGETKGRAAEAANTDAKLVAAKSKLKQLGKETARKGDFRLVNNCAVMPDGFSQMEAVRTFPSSAPDEYRSACKDEVYVMKRERDQAVAKARVAEQQRIAKVQAKQKLAAAKGKPEHKPGAIKPAAHQPAAKG